MKENNMDFVTRFHLLQNELHKAFLILIEKKGENGVLNLKGLGVLGVTFDGEPIASAKITKYGLYFLTDNEEYYGFFSENLKDMCRLYDDIVEVLP